MNLVMHSQQEMHHPRLKRDTWVYINQQVTLEVQGIAKHDLIPFLVLKPQEEDVDRGKQRHCNEWHICKL